MASAPPAINAPAKRPPEKNGLVQKNKPFGQVYTNEPPSLLASFTAS